MAEELYFLVRLYDRFGWTPVVVIVAVAVIAFIICAISQFHGWKL